MTETAPKSLRLTIALVGRANVGKSALLNRLAGQDVAIVSPQAGTTTDVVEKAMEFPPFGPVLWLDTGGWDDPTALGAARRARTDQAIARADLLLGVAADDGQPPDPDLLALARATRKPMLILVTQTDRHPPRPAFLDALRAAGVPVLLAPQDRDALLGALRPIASANSPPSPPPRPPSMASSPPAASSSRSSPSTRRPPRGASSSPRSTSCATRSTATTSPSSSRRTASPRPSGASAPTSPSAIRRSSAAWSPSSRPTSPPQPTPSSWPA